jgi:asparagine synthase (glutamine-hydrolysing)
MSAIAGIIAKHGQPVNIEPALHHLKMYGDEPGSGVWQSQHATLAYQHRPVTYRSHDEQQPLQRGPYVIVADARIDNIDDLNAHGIDTSGPDSAIILNAYEKWGERCPEYLIGDYAFAIWNAQERTLYCARDHIGARPFYYYDSPDVFVFMSDLRAIIALDEVPDVIDEQSVFNYLMSGEYDHASQRDTFLQNIRKLTYAHHLTAKNGAPKLAQYWKPEHVADIRYEKLDDYVAALQDLVYEAVKTRIDTPYGIGAHFSGGMDSSSIGVVAAQLLNHQGRDKPAFFPWTPQTDSPPAADSELHRIQAIASTVDIEPYYVKATPGFFHDFDIATRPANTLKMARVVEKVAQEQGIRVMLSGYGGDEGISFNGYGLRAKLFRRGKWRYIYNNSRPRPALKGLRKNLVYWSKLFWHEIITHHLPPFVPDPFSQFVSEKTPPDYFVTNYLKQQKYPHPRSSRLRSYGWDPHGYLHQYFYLGHLASRMESWNWSGAEHYIRYAYPLTDRRVLAFAYGVPIETFLKAGWSRFLYRKFCDTLFPQRIAWNSLGALKFAPTYLQALQLRSVAFPSVEGDFEAFLLQNWDNRWVAMERLYNVLRQQQSFDVVEGSAIYRALMISRIGHCWTQRNLHKH